MPHPNHPRDKKQAGYRSSYFAKINITNTAFGDADGYANAAIPIRGTINLRLTVEGGTRIEYSYDGYNIDGDLTPSSSTSHLEMRGLACAKIWFRVPNGGSVVRVEAWAS